MAGTHRWDPQALPMTLMLSTELNALGAAGSSALGTEFDNSLTTTEYFFGLFQLDITFALTPTIDTTVDLFIVPAPDGTNYNQGGIGLTSLNFARGSFNMNATLTQQLLSFDGILLPPTKFKCQLYNNTNRAFPATGTTLKMIPYAQRYT